MGMGRRLWLLLLLLADARFTSADEPSWKEVPPGVLRSSGFPAAHVIHDGGKAIVIDAPVDANWEDLKRHGIDSVSAVLLTHHHRDVVAGATYWLERGVAVRAPEASAPWITPAGVTEFWNQSLPAPSPSGE